MYLAGLIKYCLNDIYVSIHTIHIYVSNINISAFLAVFKYLSPQVFIATVILTITLVRFVK